MTAIQDLRLKTSLTFEHVDHLLANCCAKLYSLTLDGIEETSNGQRKVLRIAFEDPADRERFRETYQRTRNEATAPELPPLLHTANQAGGFGPF